MSFETQILDFSSVDQLRLHIRDIGTSIHIEVDRRSAMTCLLRRQGAPVRVLSPANLSSKCLVAIANMLPGESVFYLNGSFLAVASKGADITFSSNCKPIVYTDQSVESLPMSKLTLDDALESRSFLDSPFEVPPPGEFVLTSYFSSKCNPQGDSSATPDCFGLIQPWYDSIRSLGLNGVVFHDGLSRTFVRRYETERIRFVRCQLGEYSLNDERFILYLKFLLAYPTVDCVLLTDAWDVSLRDNPFPWIQVQPQELIVGRDMYNLVMHSSWCIIELLPRILPWLLRQPSFSPGAFARQPLFNAGAIAGPRSCIIRVLSQLAQMFLDLDSPSNNNLLGLNACLHLLYRDELANSAEDESQPLVTHLDQQCFATKSLFTGFPFNSRFGAYESQSKAFVVHK